MANPQVKKRIVFIVNPISGLGKQRSAEKWIRDILDTDRYDAVILYTEGTGHATELTRNAVADEVDIVVAVGGDGTVNEVGQALVNTQTAMGIIPAGSGNGLARHLKIPFNFKKAIQVINAAKIKKIDTASINDRFFLSIAGVGYDAYVARKFAKAPKRGFFTYFSIVSGEYMKYKPKNYILTIDGKEIARKALVITFANSSQFGNNVSIDSKAKLDDGLIDVCIVRRIPFLLVPFYVPLLFTKTFHKTHYVEIIKAKEVTVKRKKGKSIHFDGDAFRMGKNLEMKINPLSLNIIVP